MMPRLARAWTLRSLRPVPLVDGPPVLPVQQLPQPLVVLLVLPCSLRVDGGPCLPQEVVDLSFTPALWCGAARDGPG